MTYTLHFMNKEIKNESALIKFHTIIDEISIALLSMVIELQPKSFLNALRVLKVNWGLVLSLTFPPCYSPFCRAYDNTY